jgi:hypothetical protein
MPAQQNETLNVVVVELAGYFHEYIPEWFSRNYFENWPYPTYH